MTCPSFKMFRSTIFLFFICLSVCSVLGGRAEKVPFRTKHVKDTKARPAQEARPVQEAGLAQEKTQLPGGPSEAANLQAREGGYFLSGGVSALGALLFLKVKAVLFVIAVVLIIGLLTKVIGGFGLMCGMGGPCEGLGGFATSGHGSPTPFHPSYKEADSYFPNYSPTGGGDEYYRRAMNTFDLGFLARLMRSVDFVDLTFNVLNLEEEECRRKLVCQMDNSASQNPVMSYMMENFKVNLDKYRPEHALNATVRQDCDFLHPECKRSLNPAALNLLNF